MVLSLFVMIRDMNLMVRGDELFLIDKRWLQPLLTLASLVILAGVI